jgi:DNA-binding transcriptional LysR family regulator
MDTNLRWDQVRYFVAVARAGSLVGAARRLGVSHATVLRNISQLEARLGLRLFDHVRSGYRITADGEDVLTSAVAMEEHAEALLRRATGKDPTPEGLLKLVIADGSLFDPMPLLRRFRDAQPRIELTVEDAQGAAEVRIARLHADVAILVTNSPPENLVGRQLTRVQFGYFSSASYLASLPAGDPRPQDCHWIIWTLGSSGELDDNWHRAALRRLTGRPRVVMQTDKHAEALAAVRAGLGVSLLCDSVGSELCRLPFAEPREAFGVWLLTHPDLRRSGRVRALFDFVAEAFHGGDATASRGSSSG